MNKIASALIFTTIGAAIGSFATWHILKARYEKIYEEYDEDPYICEEDEADDDQIEINDIEKNFINRRKMDLSEYAKLLNEEGYNPVEEKEDGEKKYSGRFPWGSGDNPSNKRKKEEEESAMTDENIRIITVNEYGENPDYDMETMTYYADDILEDQNGNTINDPEDLIGIGTLDNFGDATSLYVVNDHLEKYYEVIKEDSNYFDWQDDEYMEKYSTVKKPKRHFVDDE